MKDLYLFAAVISCSTRTSAYVNFDANGNAHTETLHALLDIMGSYAHWHEAS